MKIGNYDDHVLSVQTIPLGKPVYQEPETDTIWIDKKVNGWIVRYDVNINGKISVTVWKGDKIQFSLETPDNRAKIKIVGYSQIDPKYIESDDGKNRSSDSFMKDDQSHHERKYQSSSILTPAEYFSELFPEIEHLLTDKTFTDHVSQISSELSSVPKPYSKYSK